MRPPPALGHPSRRRPAHAAALACLVVLTACATAPPGGAGSGATTRASAEPTLPPRVATPPRSNGRTSTSTSTSSSSSSISVDTGTRGAAPTSTVEVDVQHHIDDPAVVLAVRYAAHDTYDRVVIDLKGSMPGYNVKWVDKLLQDGSGEPFDLPGGAYLQLILAPADAHDAKGRPTWKGGPIFPANLGNVTHVVKTGDFEGRVGVGLVLNHQAAFELKEQSDPDRLVIDVAH
ncbi:hypothetical protein [Nonomuraea sp. NPDC049158]|uniref:AMIN-like domain-containing (lipo)protein n=1 Tax=Nonomuraea sp. NPDC049158 TaxID=3155649 RepID=UPI0033FDE5C8